MGDFDCCTSGARGDDALRAAIGAVTFNVRNFPEKVQARLLGQDMAPLNTKLTAAVSGSAWLAEVRAAAWDEGYGSDEESGMPRTNPYRHNGFDHCAGCQAEYQAKETNR